MIYISYYTVNTPYEKVIQENLLPSLKQWGLDYDIEAIDDKGSWQLNTGYKSSFIKKMLLKHKEGVTFLDADAKILRMPILLYELKNYDIAFHWLDWYLQWRSQRGGTKRELLSGTMLFNPTDKTFDLLDEWIREVKNQPNQWEQRVLQKIVEKEENNLKIFNLPAEYCTVIKYNGSLPCHVKEPVILHTQASRQYKDRRKWS